jgi:pyruvate dehydrogenase E2 component (dihydrolipoamide acetyltransferase)
MTKLRAFCMPKWGIEMTEGTVAQWMVAEGAAFKKGDTLCLIETSKITNEVEAERDGVLARVLVPAGHEEPEVVGTLLAVFADGEPDAADVDAFVADFVPADALGTAGRKRDKTEKAAAEEPAKQDTPRARIETNRPISPKALELAQDEGLDLTDVEGSGRHGRITLQDVEQALRPAARPNLRGPVELAPEDRSVFASPLARRIAAHHGIDLSALTGTGPRGRISKKDVLAKVPAPAAAGSARAAFVAVDNSPRIEKFDRVRKVVAQRLTAAKALAQHPEVNVQLHGEELHRFPHADVAVAVASDKGLVTPIVRQADRMRIDEIAQATRGLIDKAQAGKLAWDDLDGGTFTVSNLGMFGIEQFDAIINPPQAAILAVGAAERRPVETDAGDIEFATCIGLTLSVDHRAIDGAAGARFLATLKALIEDPEQLFA